MQRYQLFIGIDISKKWIDVCLSLNGKTSQMPHQQFLNNKKGFKKLLLFIQSFASKHAIDGAWLFCMEHTGVYALPLCSFLEKQSLDYVLQSALEIKRSLGLRRGKSDQTDAAYIARYAFLHQDELIVSRMPNDKLLRIKNLLSLRNRLVKANKSLKVASKELTAFSTFSGSVNRTTRRVCKELDKQIKQTEQEIQASIQESETLNRLFKLVVSVKGIGLIIGAHLLVYTNAFTAFDNARQFACYIGIAPFGHSSGSSIKRPDRVSHLANKKLKTLISNGAMSALQWDQEIKAYYHRKIGENKNKFLVQNNVKNKLIQRVFAVVKRGTPYVELNQFKA